MPIFPNPSLPINGIRYGSLLSNGNVANGLVMSQLAGTLNGVAGRSLKVLASYWGPSVGGTGGYSSALGHGYAYTSPNCGGVVARVFLAPSAGTTNATYQFTVNSVAQTTRYVAVKGGSSYGFTALEDIQIDDSTFVDGSGVPIGGATLFSYYVTPSANANFIGFVLYEVPQSSLDTSTDTCVDQNFSIGSPVTGSAVNDMVETMWTLHGHGACHVRYSFVPESGASSYRTVTGSTYANVLDGSTAGWTSSSAGFPYLPYRRGTLNSNSCPVTFWCWAKVNTGSGGRCRFTDNDGVLATITGINTTSFSLFTTTGNIDASKSTYRLCIIEQSDAGANTVTVAAAGFFERR